PAGTICSVQRAGRSPAPAKSRPLDLAAMARAVPRSVVARDPLIPENLLAPRAVLSVRAVADRRAIAARAAAHTRAPHVHRALSRPGAGDRPLRLGPLVSPALLHPRLPRRIAA